MAIKAQFVIFRFEYDIPVLPLRSSTLPLLDSGFQETPRIGWEVFDIDPQAKKAGFATDRELIYCIFQKNRRRPRYKLIYLI